MTTSLLDRAVALVVENPPMDISTIDHELTRLEKLKAGFFGFEKNAQQAVDERILELKLQRVASEKYMEYRKFVNLSMLQWRDKNGYPKIVLFSLEESKFVIRGSEWDSGCYIKPALPAKLAAQYQDVLDRLRAKCDVWYSRKESIEISCEYAGVIPEDVRESIHAAKGEFENIFIMAEATRWTESAIPKPIIDPDPLVVGWDGSNLWLVTRFDLTPIEKLLSVEFTEPAKKISEA